MEGKGFSNMNLMTKTLGRTLSSNGSKSLLLLAPSAHSGMFGSPAITRFGDWNHERLLSKMQRFRGATYLKDGAITEASLDSEGRHRLDTDYHSWHVLMMSPHGEVWGCSRYSSYRIAEGFENLAVGRSALAQSDQWGPKLRAAVERERRNALREGCNFVEVGGWAIAENLRGTTEAIRIALATFALGHCLGGCIGLTTATARHSSATLLRRIGGRPLSVDNTELPKYFDPEYECEMEILRFDSAAPTPKFAPWVDQLKMDMASVPVIAAQPSAWGMPRTENAEAPDFGTGLRLAYNW